MSFQGVRRRGYGPHPLTKKEIEMLQLLAEGVTPREICERGLKVSLRACHHHIDRIRLKLDSFTTPQAVIAAYKRGLIK